jgi:ABC-2 type transport system ATP-binding protein
VLTEQHGLYTRMPAYEYLEVFGKIYGLEGGLLAQRIARWMAYFGLWEFRTRRIGTYSKGMRQKLALARALLHEPPVLLLDEPTSAMDPESARLVREAIRGLRSQERAILLCTHNLYEAEALADRIAIMRAGRVVAVGTPQELKDRWLGVPVFVVMLSRPVEPPLPAFPPTVEVLRAKGRTLEFRSPHWQQDNASVVAALVAAGYGVLKVAEAPRNLEQVYLEVMAHEKA